MKNHITLVTAIILVTASICGMEQIQVTAHRLQSQLFKAARNGDHQKIASLITKGALVNLANKHGTTVLICAAANGSPECIRVLISSGAQLNSADKHGNTALRVAAIRGHQECVRLLIAAGAQLNSADRDGYTALMGAIINGLLECFRELITAKAEVNCYDNNGKTALMLAAARGRLEICKLLVERLLYAPNRGQDLGQISSIFTAPGCVTALGCLPSLECWKGGCSRNDIKSLFSRAFKDAIYCHNRRNFAQSIAGQAVAKLPDGEIKTKLLEKYSASSNTIQG